LTYAELLQRKEEILTAIRKIETEGQEYRIGDRVLRRADLPSLYQQLQQIDQQLSRVQSGGMFTYVRLKR